MAAAVTAIEAFADCPSLPDLQKQRGTGQQYIYVIARMSVIFHNSWRKIWWKKKIKELSSVWLVTWACIAGQRVSVATMRHGFTSATIAVSAASVCSRDILRVTVTQRVSSPNGRYLSPIRDTSHDKQAWPPVNMTVIFNISLKSFNWYLLSRRSFPDSVRLMTSSFQNI